LFKQHVKPIRNADFLSIWQKTVNVEYFSYKYTRLLKSNQTLCRSLRATRERVNYLRLENVNRHQLALNFGLGQFFYGLCSESFIRVGCYNNFCFCLGFRSTRLLVVDYSVYTIKNLFFTQQTRNNKALAVDSLT